MLFQIHQLSSQVLHSRLATLLQTVQHKTIMNRHQQKKIINIFTSVQYNLIQSVLIGNTFGGACSFTQICHVEQNNCNVIFFVTKCIQCNICLLLQKKYSIFKHFHSVFLALADPRSKVHQNFCAALCQNTSRFKSNTTQRTTYIYIQFRF
jgi:hypothetical protein